ncbi:MAG: hypothetical protein ACRD3E_20430 [Terriglobales bacterium]
MAGETSASGYPAGKEVKPKRHLVISSSGDCIGAAYSRMETQVRIRAIWMIAALVALTAMTALAVDKKGTVEELKQRLENTTKAKDRVELAMAIVERQFDSADQAYGAGKTDDGQKEIADVEKYGVLAANESSKSGQRMKQTEIALRKVEDRLDNLARSVDIDSRPPVRDTLNQIDKARSALLLHMFK